MSREIKIEKLAYGGEGLGWVDNKVCFVEGALPDETVRAEILQNKKKFLRARTVEVLAPSQHRVNPPCPYYGACGGCQYQHIHYLEELRWKEIQVREHLQRNLQIDGGIVAKIVPSPKEYHYRSSATFHRTAQNQLGFFAKDNKTVIPIERCLLLDEKLLPTGISPDQNSITFKISKGGNIFSNHDGQFLEMAVGSEAITSHSQSFFQNNAGITQAIAATLKGWIEAVRPNTFIDLYAGAGTFTILSAQGVPNLVLAEEHSKSILALEKNINARGLTAVLIEGKAEKEFPKWLRDSKPEKAFLFLDPPRQGMDQSFAEFLGRQKGFASIAYLSCHLGTLARDLGLILTSESYQIRQVIPFDMFPKTKHIEVLTLLTPAD